MNNWKKYFAFAMATAMVLGAVWFVTPAMKSYAGDVTPTEGKSPDEKEAEPVETTTEDKSSDEKEAEPVQATKQNATPAAVTSEERAKQEQTPQDIENYNIWYNTYGPGAGGTAGATVVQGTIGQPGSEAIINNGSGEQVSMFQSTDTSNTLFATSVGTVPTGTKITTVEVASDSSTFTAAQNAVRRVSRRGTVAKVFGITGTTPDGTTITTLNGKAAISIPVPTDISVPAGMALHVYLVADDGTSARLETVIDQGRVVCGTQAFGTFAFVVERP